MCMNGLLANGQNNNPPKRELRAAWIATVGNIDWPSKSGLSSDEQKAEFIYLLNLMQMANLNCAIVQIRPSADAFYPSALEGWSKYLSGTEGMPPTPYYDPLQFMVEACHERGMELHAWFNPYRALVDAKKNNKPYHHPTHTNPEWFFNYGGKKYFNPGVPAVRTFFLNVIKDVVSKYDIDAVHLDDYFYPYKIGKQDFPDQKTYLQYGQGFYNKDDWRRNNVTQLIKELNQSIKAIKPYVKIGISPFGVWRNIANDPDGSYTTAGVQNYDDLYADVLLWQRNGWIDYLMPQLYWERGHKAADFITLLEWWNRHTYNRGMYIGLGAYQMHQNKKPQWQSSQEIAEQIVANRTAANIAGYSLYSANCLLKNKYGIVQTLQYNSNNAKAIIPAMKWMDSIAPKAPTAKIILGQNGLATIKLLQQSQDANCFVVYQFLKNESININNAKAIIAIQGKDNFVLPTNFKQYQYVITSLDRAKNESQYTIAQ
jgi:uncharacterized lipoprotein YddW (UPF0748 family)